jgi:hypothetical protein
MGFVKLDCGILNSTLWIAKEPRDVFITALLMAEPCEYPTPIPQIEVRSLEYTGWEAPPGWYGFVPAAGIGIIRRAMVDVEDGMSALEKLGAPEPESRSQDFGGRRLIRIDGGYLVLNFMKYRDRDYTGAERAKRYRERLKAKASHRDTGASHRDITQAEFRVQSSEEDVKNTPQPPEGGGPAPKRKRVPSTAIGLKAWLSDIKARGEKPVPADDPIFAYAARVGLPEEFLALAWAAFKNRYLTQHPDKRYRDWRRVFRNAVEGNWSKLWWLDPAAGTYGLTTVGLQAKRDHDGRAAA